MYNICLQNVVELKHEVAENVHTPVKYKQRTSKINSFRGSTWVNVLYLVTFHQGSLLCRLHVLNSISLERTSVFQTPYFPPKTAIKHIYSCPNSLASQASCHVHEACTEKWGKRRRRRRRRRRKEAEEGGGICLGCLPSVDVPPSTDDLMRVGGGGGGAQPKSRVADLPTLVAEQVGSERVRVGDTLERRRLGGENFLNWHFHIHDIYQVRL